MHSKANRDSKSWSDRVGEGGGSAFSWSHRRAQSDNSPLAVHWNMAYFLTVLNHDQLSMFRM